jgi:hypothetical protein
MSTIEERLNRREFQHTPGATLTGQIIGVTEGHWPYGYYPVLVVRDDNGVEHILSCYLDKSWLAEPVITARPKVGERIGLRCDEPETSKDNKSYNRGAVEFERDDAPEPDWDRMIQSRIESRRDRDDKAAGNGGATDTDTSDPWASKSTTETTNKWKEDTTGVEPEPPF